MSLGLFVCESECVCLCVCECLFLGVWAVFLFWRLFMGISVYSVYVCLSLSLQTCGKMLLASSYLHPNPAPIWASCSILPSR